MWIMLGLNHFNIETRVRCAVCSASSALLLPTSVQTEPSVNPAVAWRSHLGPYREMLRWHRAVDDGRNQRPKAIRIPTFWDLPTFPYLLNNEQTQPKSTARICRANLRPLESTFFPSGQVFVGLKMSRICWRTRKQKSSPLTSIGLK